MATLVKALELPAGTVESEVQAGPVSGPGPRWFVVQVKPRREAQVLRRLALGAVSTFLPFIEVARRRGPARRRGLEPLFPGYLFVRMFPVGEAPAAWSRLRWTPGIVRILGIGETPVPVPEEFIEAIQERTKELGFVRLPSPLMSGMRVRLRSGPFQDLEAVFDRPLSRAGRVRVLLKLLGQPRPVEVDEDCLEPA
ncbi:MAG: transcription termination/antitermination NusG family protein [Armatimonadota bacterium]|nr:transcription termination/antitermination NusG family protein [Armatimonadota bacterium]MDR7452273.1 transcription termination/antitermination NusG family protein [Armatimonadota bacterium]MDR7467963.1 transcription termination/antitermination NusG family protein [Armatimonadota bacterium]MDR7494805.1 transcription termination/antitermination NusG family protein [Armatimonadota bacterium]MDR7499241.1 transcription termination/antitermination NusG family protein [Armatimonadota bacterium]